MPIEPPATGAGVTASDLADELARRIRDELAPRSVVAAAPDTPALVASLRELGVPADELDPSGADDPPPSSASDGAGAGDGRRAAYDLAVSTAQLDGPGTARAGALLRALCSRADDLLVSLPGPVPGGAEDGEVSPDWCLEQLAHLGFVRDLDYDARFLGASAVRVRRASEPLARSVARLDRALARAEDDRRLLRAEVERLERARAHAEGVLESARDHDRALIDHLTERNAVLEGELQSGAYRISQKLHDGLRRALPEGTRRGSLLSRATLAALLLMRHGPRRLAKRALVRSGWVRPRSDLLPFARQYALWLEQNEPAGARLEALRVESDRWDWRPLVSVVMPVYDPQASWLEEAIDSVRQQTYQNWELCIADDASPSPHVRAILERAAAADGRIRVAFHDTNLGIGGASNTALGLARGEYVGLLDHDDLIRPHAIHSVVAWLRDHRDTPIVYSDEDKLLVGGERGDPFFKPDWSPQLLFSANYVCHFLVYRRDLLERIGGFRTGFDGSQDYDLILRATDDDPPVGHIPEVLYSWRQVPGSASLSTGAKPYAYRAAMRAINEALRRRGRVGHVIGSNVLGWYHVRDTITGAPSVAIIIPTRDRLDLLRPCVESIVDRSRYRRYEIVLVDNDSSDPETLEYLRSCGHRVVRHPGAFDFAAIMNHAAAEVDADHLLLLNNDITVISADWIEALLEHSQRPEVGAVGARLLFPNGDVQHEGVAVGLRCTATSVDMGGYFGLGWATRDVSAVTGACMMIRRAVFEELGGFDANLPIAYNDIDLCLRLRRRGYRIVYTPLAELHHHEGASRGTGHPAADEEFFLRRWGGRASLRDPYLSPHIDWYSPLTLKLQL